MAILELTMKIFESIENDECTIGIFIDIRKAFDIHLSVTSFLSVLTVSYGPSSFINQREKSEDP